MSIFQKSIIKKHLTNLDDNLVEESYKIFRMNFSHSKIEKIKQLKEEEYQDGFLRDLFVDVLGYTLKPDDNFDLVREFKNQTDGKKADGAILKDAKAIAVIELKSTTTKDLTKVTEQAFNYKNNQPSCKYVITSNFQKLRFYIDYTNEYEEFNLFNLAIEDFELLYLLLNKGSIFSDLPILLKKETEFHEQNVSDKLYKDYSIFKNKLFENLVKNNSDFDKLTLFKKSQKLLDRFLFILFAEDRGLLPPNSISRIIKRYNILKEEDAYKPIYDIYKQYFGYMNSGRKGKNVADDVPAYNGGLFVFDEVLESLVIDDDILINDLLNLSEYDFNTEVDVNILGHIFEHSLNEIETIEAEIVTKGTSIPLTSKRKKDGVFYTPKYITQYIVENTIGTLCQEKRKELEVEDVEFDGTYRTKNNTLSSKGKNLFKKLESYKDWLKSLKIVDPACGSGAFLNQALNFLIKEHKNIDDIISELTNTEIRLYDTEKAILENNLYGVDINEESVEIAKLSLWLRTARKDRKLSNLNNNIKCGNSLIDDPTVAGDKAFNWEKEFPQVFKTEKIISAKKEIEVEIDYLNLIEKNAKLAMEKAKESAKFSQEAIDYSKKVTEYTEKQRLMVGEPKELFGIDNGGFDVVIGNPPYVFAREKIAQLEKEYYKKNFISAEYQFNTYLLFIEQSINLLKNKAVFSLIVPNAWLMVGSASKLRKLILERCSINAIVNLFGYSFQGINVETIIINAKKERTINNSINIYTSENEIFAYSHNRNQNDFTTNSSYEFSVFADNKSKLLVEKICKSAVALDDLVSIKAGLKAYEKGKGKPKQTAEDVQSRPYDFDYQFDNTTYKYLEGKDVNRYFITWSNNYLKYGKHLAAPRTFNLFDDEKIIVREITGNYPKSIIASYTNETYLFNMSNIVILQENKNISLKYILSLLNSSLISFYFLKNTAKSVRKMFPKVILKDLRQFPIREISIDNQKLFIEKSDKLLALNKVFHEKKKKFLNRVDINFDILNIPKKIETFYDYDFKTFNSELKRKKVNLDFHEQEEWEAIFTPAKDEINTIQANIRTTDNEIDQMVYELYELTEEEIKIIERTI